MNAPILWIFLPLAIGGFALLFRNEHVLTLLGGMGALVLSLLAFIIPIDTALLIGSFSFKLAGSLNVLGRSFVLEPADGPLLAILYGLAAMWFFGAEAMGLARRLIPAGLAILSLLVAATAVRPFLFAAVFIEIAVLLSVPMLLPPNQKPGRGILRYIIFQTLAVPFILFAGWLLSGVETSPGDVAMTLQAMIMLTLGFAFLLSIFPLYTWIPMLIEEAPPYLVGFLLWLLPQTTALFAMGFLDRYPFLRLSADLMNLLRSAGLLMVVSAGVWAAFQRHLGRLMGYAAIAETGFLLIALGLGTASGIQLVFLQIIPRGLGLAVWAMSLSMIQSRVESPRFVHVQGVARVMPFATAGVVIANLSVAGFPLLAGFPIRIALLESLARQSLALTIWVSIGLLGLMTGAIRALGVAVLSGTATNWQSRETRTQVVLVVLGILALIVLGFFPQASNFLLKDLPALFQNLGQ
jgi:formate hydrogenlyase subunit 3/multisubunit Na+/H+ antiporter MnhD subunit